VIRQGAVMLGWELETLMERTIRAMAASEATMMAELETLLA
jgi:predicted GTPase